ITEQYERAKKTLRENMDGLNKLATQLLDKEVIFSEDVEKIFGPRKNHRTDLDGKPKSRRKSSTPRAKTSDTEPKLTKKEKEEETPRSKTA
ncbi:MAG: cell division protein FtsH, partial [Bacteroidales bacterium]